MTNIALPLFFVVRHLTLYRRRSKYRPTFSRGVGAEEQPASMPACNALRSLRQRPFSVQHLPARRHQRSFPRENSSGGKGRVNHRSRKRRHAARCL